MACYYTLSSRSLNRESACHIQADCSDRSKDHFCTIQTTTRRQQRRQATPSSHSFCERSQKLVRRKFRRLLKLCSHHMHANVARRVASFCRKMPMPHDGKSQWDMAHRMCTQSILYTHTEERAGGSRRTVHYSNVVPRAGLY